MPVYLFENIHVVPGQTTEYIRGFAERWLPLSDHYDRDLYAISGVFVPDVLYNTQPTLNTLWTIHSWEAWDGRHRRPSAEELLRKYSEFYVPAVGWRSGWTDKMIEPLSFSPVPPVRPDSARPGALVINHSFVVKPEHCAAFVSTFRDDVIPAATAAGLTLELFARVIGHPTEYLAFWTIPSGKAYTEWRTRRNADEITAILPGFDTAWPMLTDVEERELTPTWFSPLGGSQTDPKAASEENLSV